MSTAEEYTNAGMIVICICKSGITIKKSNRIVYSERFDDDLPNDGYEMLEPQIIITETEKDAEISGVTDNVRVSRSPNAHVNCNRNSSKGTGESSPRLSRKNVKRLSHKPRYGRGRAKKKQPVEDYVRLEEPSTFNYNSNANTEIATADVYVDSHQVSDTNSEATTKSKSSLSRKERYALKPIPLMESAVFEDGVRKSRRTKFLKTDRPNAGIVVTTKELDALYRKSAPPRTNLTTKYTRKSRKYHFIRFYFSAFQRRKYSPLQAL